jgi:flagellar biosynthesis GTPase FlhF
VWWLTLKKWWAKGSVWCRQHWRWLVMFAVFVMAYCFGRKNSRSLLVQSKLALKQAEKESQIIEESYQKEIKMREEAKAKYDQGMNKLRNEFSDKNSQLEAQKEKKIKEMLKKAKSDPDALDKILEQELGIKKI